MSRSLPVKGLEEIDRNLSHFPMNMQKAAYRQGLTAAARPVRDRARELARKRSGKMAKSIKTGSARQNQDGSFSISIRPDGEHGFLALFMEFGVAPHFIQSGDSGMSPRLLTRAARRGDVLGDTDREVLKIDGNFISGEVMHPGHAARPFMRPAADLAFGDAVQAFADKIRAYMQGKTGLTLTDDEAA